MIADRAFVCEVLLFVLPNPEWRSFWNGRADALVEVYTELKGRGYAAKVS